VRYLEAKGRFDFSACLCSQKSYICSNYENKERSVS
jgi:hypothetical protein